MDYLKTMARMSLWIILVVSIASCAALPPRSTAELESDNNLELAVTHQLNAAPNLYARHIDVSVNRGVVTLGGYVFENGDLFTAGKVASSVPGVVSVNNQVQVEVMGRGGRR